MSSSPQSVPREVVLVGGDMCPAAMAERRLSAYAPGHRQYLLEEFGYKFLYLSTRQLERVMLYMDSTFDFEEVVH